MIGNGGYADQRIAGTLPKRSAAPVMAFDERIYQNISTGMFTCSLISALIVLILVSADFNGGHCPVGFNGYVSMTMLGPKLTVRYKTGQCIDSKCLHGVSSTNSTTVFVETFEVSLNSGAVSHIVEHVGKELTVPL